MHSVEHRGTPDITSSLASHLSENSQDSILMAKEIIRNYLATSVDVNTPKAQLIRRANTFLASKTVVRLTDVEDHFKLQSIIAELKVFSSSTSS